MKTFAQAATLALSVLIGPVAYAGPFTDDLSKCLVRSTTADDQVAFMQWMFSAISLHPAVRSLTTITDQQRAEFNKKAAALFVRLTSVDCRRQTIDAVKYEGGTAIQVSFELFGGAATQGLMSNLEVAKGLQGLSAYFQHDENWILLLREAGANK